MLTVQADVELKYRAHKLTHKVVSKHQEMCYLPDCIIHLLID